MHNYGHNLQFVSDDLKADKDVVLASVKNGHSLKYAADSLKDDKEVVLTAVSDNGLSLTHASDNLKADSEVALAAVQENYLSFEFASDYLKDNEQFVLSAMKYDSRVIFRASDRIYRMIDDVSDGDNDKRSRAEKLARLISMKKSKSARKADF